MIPTAKNKQYREKRIHENSEMLKMALPALSVAETCLTQSVRVLNEMPGLEQKYREFKSRTKVITDQMRGYLRFVEREFGEKGMMDRVGDKVMEEYLERQEGGNHDRSNH